MNEVLNVILIQRTTSSGLIYIISNQLIFKRLSLKNVKSAYPFTAYFSKLPVPLLLSLQAHANGQWQNNRD